MKLIRTLGMVPLLLCSLTVFSIHAEARALISSHTPDVGPSNSFWGVGADTSGYTFTALFDMTITHLGTVVDPNYLVDGSTPLDNDHEVGLWDSNGIVAQATIRAWVDGVSDIEDGFIYEALQTQIDLEAGMTYTLGALYDVNDGDAFGSVVSSAITTDGIDGGTVGVYTAENAGFARPTEFALTAVAHIGPNARFIARTPEPGTVLLLGLGLIGFGISRRRRR